MKSRSVVIPSPDKDERIAKRMARAGLCSRREAEALILSGRVKVDGETIGSPALNVRPGQSISVDDEVIGEAPATCLYRYHKGKGLLVATKDPQGRPTIFERMPTGLPRLMPIGRLDLNSEGLLLLTNDGELKRHLELPKTGWLRRYRVRVFGHLDQQALDALRNGVKIDGIKYGRIDVSVEAGEKANRWLRVGLREGKNREIRRILGHLGLDISRLIRTGYGPFQLGNLTRGAAEMVTGKVLREQLGGKLKQAA